MKNKKIPDDQSAKKTIARPPKGEPTPAPESLPWQEGSLIAGLYQIKSLLGRGGMGEVWLVHHTRWI